MKRWTLVVVLALVGCTTVGPDYVRPHTGLRDADRYAAATVPGATPSEADLHWWRHFDDPLLTQSVELALAGNLDIAIAAERVQQARALLRSAQAAGGLTVDGLARLGATRRQTSGDVARDSARTGTAITGGNVSAGINLDWDADLWGGLRQGQRSAAASLLRSEDLVQATRLATAALAARSVIALREIQHERALLAQTLQVREDTQRIVAVQVDVGLAPTLDLLRARADVAAIQAELDDAGSRLRQAALALRVLAGQRPTPGAVDDAGLAAPFAVQSVAQSATLPPIARASATLALPRPIDLLRLRPDIRAAERALMAATADIGVAEAALYPSLRLPGELLLSASGLGTGSIVRTLTTSLAAALQIPLFDSGARAAALDDAQSRAREAALVYRRTVLQALEQVEAALTAGQSSRAQLAARVAAVEASATALEQVRTLYTEGLVGFLDVLEAQRTWLVNQLAVIATQAAAARAAVASFEAVGLIPPPDSLKSAGSAPAP